MGIRLPILAAAVMALLGSSAAFADTADPTIALGRAHYEARDYAAAEQCFQRAAEMNFDDPEAHYWYATVLAVRMKGSQAIAEYKRCLSLNPPPPIAAYCRQALAAYHARVPAYQRVVEARRKQPAVPVDAEVHQPPDPERQRAADRIVNDLTSDMQRLQWHYNQAETLKQLDGQRRADRLVEEGDRITRDMKYSGQSTGVPGYRVPCSVSQLNRIQEEYKQRAQAAQDLASQDAQAIHDQLLQRQSSLAESAANLQDQLTAPLTPNGAVLQPLGSNLYVRNYMTSPDDDGNDKNGRRANGGPSPAQAIAQSLNRSKQPAVSSDRAQAKSIGNPGKDRGSEISNGGARVQTSVTGKLIPEKNP